MKLIFKKNDDSSVAVFIEDPLVEKDFSYIEMLKGLIEDNGMDEPEISGDFSEEEKQSIKSMTEKINEIFPDTGPRITQL